MSISRDLIAPNGEKHGMINVVANSVKAEDGCKNMDAKTKAEYEKRKLEDKKIIKARYMNSRGDNERLQKPYCKHAGDAIETWNFIPGQEYDVWKGLVDEVNDPSKRLPKRSDLMGPNGRPLLKDEFHPPLHQFVPVSF